jgi:hypothetical protein
LHANSFTPTGQYNKAQNEKLYIEAFSAELKKQGMPSQAITDTSRNGVQGLRKEWGHCEYLSESKKQAMNSSAYEFQGATSRVQVSALVPRPARKYRLHPAATRQHTAFRVQFRV